MPQNILLIQDDPTDATAVRQALVGSNDGPFQVEWVRRCAEGLARLAGAGKQREHRADGIAAVLVDLFLPDSQGIDTFDRLFKAAPEIPILVLVGRSARSSGLSPEKPARQLLAAQGAAHHGRTRGKQR